MILFHEDFAKQGAIVDYETKNTTFIKMAMVLKHMGIKNNKFMLALHNPNLQGIDPHSVDLTEEQQLQIAEEIKINPWYFLREVVRIPSQGTAGGLSFQLDRASLAFFWVYMNSINVYETIPRQIGKTMAALSLTAWIIFFAAVSTNVGLFARGNSLQVENVKRLKDIRDTLPKYLIHRDANGIDANNKEGITYTAFNNQYKTFTAQSEIQSALDQGRGQSLAITHWDEFAYYKMNWLSFPAAIATTDRAADDLRATGVPVANIVTTTAGRLDEKRGKYAFKVRSECMQFTEHMYDEENHKTLAEKVKINSGNSMIYIEFNHKQLGKDDAWFAKRIENKDPDVVNMDYRNRWISGTAEGIVPLHLLEKINDSLMAPKHVTMINQIRVLWYVDQEEYESEEFHERPFVMGCDTADNVGRDFTTLVLVDPADMRVIATARSNISNLILMGKAIVSLMREFPRAIFIPERQKNGQDFIDLILLEMEFAHFRPLRRIYNSVVQNFDDGSEAIDRFDYRGEGRKVFGFSTGASTRDDLVKQTLFNTLNINHSKIYDQELISEICSLKMKGQRIDHSDDAHDDLLFAYLLACWLILYGKNIEYYGLEPYEVLEKMDKKGNPIGQGEKARQMEIQRRLQELEYLIEYCSSEIQRRQYVTEKDDLLRRKNDNIIDSSIISVSQVKQENKTAPSIDIFDPQASARFWSAVF